jgi:hypothetical protein
VWSDYDLVLHGASGSYASSSANGYVGMAEGVTSGPGKIGDASHVVMTFDGSTRWMMRDGDLAEVQHFDDLPGGMTSLAASPGPLVLGGASHAMNGLVDEIRVSRQYRHPDWVQARYLSMSDRFITYPLPSELL